MLASNQTNFDIGAISICATQLSVPNFYYRSDFSNHELLAASGEREICINMQSHALAMLATLATSDAGLNCLLDVTTDIIEYLNTANEASYSRPSEMDAILGLIDDIQTIVYVGEKNHLRCKKRKLLAKLASWGPPPYLVVNMLFNRDLSRLDVITTQALKKTASFYIASRNQMATRNLRLVLAVASKYNNLGTHYDDLVQEGYIGLLKAVERFDYRLGYRFSTYAYRAVSQNIHLAVHKNSSLVRKPFSKMKESRVIEGASGQLEQQLGRRPCLAEVADYISMPLNTIKAIVDSQNIAAVEPKSDSSEVAEYLYSRGSQNSSGDELMERSADSAAIERAMFQLTQRNRLIVKMRFGIGCRKDHTLEEIAIQTGLTKERVRQIVNSSIEKIKTVLL